MLWLLPLAFLAAPLVVFVYAFVKYRIRNSRSPLRKLPGPKSQSWLYGNIKEILEKGQSVAWDEWASTYGKTFQYPVMFNVHSLSFCRNFHPQLMLSRLIPSLPRTLER